MSKIYFIFSAIFCLLLTACSRPPVSYLPAGTKPIVNIEAPLAEKMDVNASSSSLNVQNLTANTLNVSYKLFWYDENGVTQMRDADDRTFWQNVGIAPYSESEIPLIKPTNESVNYRVYLRNKL